MGQWLLSFPLWLNVLAVGFAGLATLAILAILSIVLVNRGNVRIGKGGLEIESAGIAGRKKPHHSGCKHVGDIILVLNKAQAIADNVFQIKYIETIREQMSYVDSKAIQIRGVLERVFIDALSRELKREGTDAEVLAHRDYRVYSLCLDKLHLQNSEYLRVGIRENHYAEISEVEFDVYVEHKIETLAQMTTSLLNVAYFGEVITRGTLYKLNMDRASQELRSLLYEVFLNARRIAVEKSKLIAKCQSERDDFINMILGVDGVSPLT